MSDDAEALVENYLKRACVLLDNNSYSKGALPTQTQTILVAAMLQIAEISTDPIIKFWLENKAK